MPNLKKTVKRIHSRIFKLPLSNYLFIYIAFVSLLLVFIIPPFQKTDETSHYYKTIAVARGQFTCKTNQLGQKYNTIPANYETLPDVLLAEYVNKDHRHRFLKQTFNSVLRLREKSNDGVIVSSVCNLPFILYTPTALVLSIPILLNINPILVFYLGRLTFCILALALIYISSKIIPKKFRLLLLGYLALPMVSIQLGSFNKEVFHLAFGALSFASFMKLREDKNKILQKKSKAIRLLIILLFSFAVLIISRPFYLPILLLALLPFSKKIKKKAKYLIFALVAIGAVVGFVYLPTLKSFHSSTIFANGISSRIQLEYIRTFPNKFISIFTNSYTNHVEAYYKSMIGTYGSIHYYLDSYIYAFFGIWLFVLLMHYKKVKFKLNKKELIVISFTLVAIVFLASFLMYLYATPIGYHYIIDVQGRYFINLIPYAILVLAELLKNHQKKIIILAFILAILFLIKNSYNRYFDYSEGYALNNQSFNDKYIHSIRINEEIVSLLNVDSNKKIVGLMFKIVKEEGVIYPPLLIKTYEADCTTQLRKNLLVTHIDEIRGEHNIKFSPITNREKNKQKVINWSFSNFFIKDMLV